MAGVDIKAVEKYKDYNFYIPDYQRGYRWEKEHVVRYLEDLLTFFERVKEKLDLANNGVADRNKEMYCLQPLVLGRTSTEGPWRVIDGQQRLTTTYLVLKYLRPGEKSFYSLEYQTRKDSKKYLETLDEAQNNMCADYYYLYNAYEAIKDWFEDENEEKRVTDVEVNGSKYSRVDAIKSIIYKHVKFIEYITDDNEIEVFTRLNVGKISLTEAELIKAILLNENNFKNTEMSQKDIAKSWDEIEYALRDDKFWLFINSPSYTGFTRIDYILQVIREAEINKIISSEDRLLYPNEDEKFEAYITNESKDMYTFEFFETLVEKEGVDVSKIWKKVIFYFDTIVEWFNDTYMYHLIGFLRDDNYVSLNELILNYVKIGAKDKYLIYLLEMCKNRVECEPGFAHKDEYDEILKEGCSPFKSMIMATDDSVRNFSREKMTTKEKIVEHILEELDYVEVEINELKKQYVVDGKIGLNSDNKAKIKNYLEDKPCTKDNIKNAVIDAWSDVKSNIEQKNKRPNQLIDISKTIFEILSENPLKDVSDVGDFIYGIFEKNKIFLEVHEAGQIGKSYTKIVETLSIAKDIDDEVEAEKLIDKLIDEGGLRTEEGLKAIIRNAVVNKNKMYDISQAAYSLVNKKSLYYDKSTNKIIKEAFETIPYKIYANSKVNLSELKWGKNELEKNEILQNLGLNEEFDLDNILDDETLKNIIEERIVSKGKNVDIKGIIEAVMSLNYKKARPDEKKEIIVDSLKDFNRLVGYHEVSTIIKEAFELLVVPDEMVSEKIKDTVKQYIRRRSLVNPNKQDINDIISEIISSLFSLDEKYDEVIKQPEELIHFKKLKSIQVSNEIIKKIASYDNNSLMNEETLEKCKNVIIKMKDIVDWHNEYKGGEGKTHCRPMLLWHNIQTILLENKSLQNSEKYGLTDFMRFPFHLYKKRDVNGRRAWDIEHIRPDNLMDYEKATGKDVKRKIYIELIRMLWPDKSNDCDTALNNMLKAKTESKKFEEFSKFISNFDAKVFRNQLKEENRNQIWNYTLLDSATNRSYGNHIYAIKRLFIMEREEGFKPKIVEEGNSIKIIDKGERDIAFVPPCTLKVFSKGYTNLSSNNTCWTQVDAEGYLLNIQLKWKALLAQYAELLMR